MSIPRQPDSQATESRLPTIPAEMAPPLGPEVDGDAYWARLVWRELAQQALPQESPRAIIIVTPRDDEAEDRATNAAAEQFSSHGKAALVDHARITRLFPAAAYPNTDATAVSAAAATLASLLLANSIERRVNVVVHLGPWEQDACDTVVAALRQANYEIEVRSGQAHNAPPAAALTHLRDSAESSNNIVPEKCTVSLGETPPAKTRPVVIANFPSVANTPLTAEPVSPPRQAPGEMRSESGTQHVSISQLLRAGGSVASQTPGGKHPHPPDADTVKPPAESLPISPPSSAAQPTTRSLPAADAAIERRLQMQRKIRQHANGEGA